MKKILILPYFGEFNSYFRLWVESCRLNKGIDYLLITDNKLDFSLPDNMKYKRTSFARLRAVFQEKFGYPVSLRTPYKLCDYKPYYGFLFKEYLKNYNFWGYCDCDLIFGDVLSFLPDTLFEHYDKILRRGHLSFIRNSREINQNFQKYNTYRIVTTSNLIYGYDESLKGYHLGFAGELEAQGFHFYRESQDIADIDFRYRPFHDVSEQERTYLFEVERGRLYKIWKENDKLQKEEIMYVHLQKRRMSVDSDLDVNHYYIIPNRFIRYDKDLVYSDRFWKYLSTDKKGYFNARAEQIYSLRRDIRRFIHEPDKLDALRYRLSQK